MKYSLRQKGFTLIELLVVIAIIGILSSVVLASLTAARQKARDAKRVAEMDSITKALELYFSTNSSYPPTTPAGYAAPDAALKLLVAAGNLSTLPPGIVPSPGYIYYGTNEEGVPATECDTTEPCRGYILAVVLERDDHPSLQTDFDVAAFGPFSGTSADCVGGAGAERCYEKVR